MEAAATSTFDAIRRQTYHPVELTFGDDKPLVAILTDVRGEGTSDVSLSLRFDTPQYGELAKKLGRALVLSIDGETYHARLHAIHPESTNIVSITARFK